MPRIELSKDICINLPTTTHSDGKILSPQKNQPSQTKSPVIKSRLLHTPRMSHDQQGQIKYSNSRRRSLTTPYAPKVLNTGDFNNFPGLKTPNTSASHQHLTKSLCRRPGPRFDSKQYSPRGRYLQHEPEMDLDIDPLEARHFIAAAQHNSGNASPYQLVQWFPGV